MNKLPPNLQIVTGEKSSALNKAVDAVKNRIPQAEWMDNHDAWDKAKFVDETSQFMLDTYGIGTDQDRHTLAMLADQIDLYVKCSKALSFEPIIIEYNGGKTFGANPHIAVRNEALKRIVALMTELGLTPKGRLAKNKAVDNTVANKLMRGAKG